MVAIYLHTPSKISGGVYTQNLKRAKNREKNGEIDKRWEHIKMHLTK
jgi:hypothetical protein